VIKKDPAPGIGNRIAGAFRTHNIIEYKSPRYCVSVFDFNKVLAYAGLYSVPNRIPLEKLSLTFVEDHYPRKLFGYLTDGSGYAVEYAAGWNLPGDP
jgi:hypothetical protein